MKKATTQQKVPPELRNLNRMARFMDAQFSIPGTNIRFGFDAIVGLVPGIGDFISFLFSSYMISTAMNKGASGFVVSRMVFNVAVDAIVGAIPVLGDIFDVAFRANQRNMRLLQQHYGEGKHQGSAKKVIIPVIIVMLAVFAGLIWLLVKLIAWIF